MSVQDNQVSRLLIVLAGLTGAVGIMAAAAASHGDSRNLASIATVCLAHGPALLALGLAARSKVLTAAGLVLAAGTFVFVLDLTVRQWEGHGLFAGAAPIGGGCMILGWVVIAIGGFSAKRKT